MVASRIGSKIRAFRTGARRRAEYARPFRAEFEKRVLLVGQNERIPRSQVFPFLHYRKDLSARFGADVSEVFLDDFLSGKRTIRGATHVLFQSSFELDDTVLDTFSARVHATSPDARIAYLDWFAPTDLRLAERLDPVVDLYVKKTLLRNREAYGLETFGDTNLMDFYGRRFGLSHEAKCFAIPPGFMDKLVLGPAFVTANSMLPDLENAQMPKGARKYDLHARITDEGTPWYSAMRRECNEAVERLRGISAVTGTGVSREKFLSELRRSKLCFSPFGYGEVCWRDFEAILSGAVLIKQDMGHVESLPDVFIPGETYAPVRWDLADLEDTIQSLLRDEPLRQRMATAALDRLRGFAEGREFVDWAAQLVAD